MRGTQHIFVTWRDQSSFSRNDCCYYNWPTIPHCPLLQTDSGKWQGLTNAIEGNFLFAEKGAAITIELIHVITFFTFASAEDRNVSHQLQDHSCTGDCPSLVMNFCEASGKSLSLCESLLFHLQNEMLKRCKFIRFYYSCLIWCFWWQSRISASNSFSEILVNLVSQIGMRNGWMSEQMNKHIQFHCVWVNVTAVSKW